MIFALEQIESAYKTLLLVPHTDKVRSEKWFQVTLANLRDHIAKAKGWTDQHTQEMYELYAKQEQGAKEIAADDIERNESMNPGGRF